MHGPMYVKLKLLPVSRLGQRTSFALCTVHSSDTCHVMTTDRQKKLNYSAAVTVLVSYDERRCSEVCALIAYAKGPG
jgi:hypothetical protein